MITFDNERIYHVSEMLRLNKLSSKQDREVFFGGEGVVWWMWNIYDIIKKKKGVFLFYFNKIDI